MALVRRGHRGFGLLGESAVLFFNGWIFFAKLVRTHGKPFACLRRYVIPPLWIFLAWTCVHLVIPKNWPSAVLDQGWWQPFYSEILKNMDVLPTEHIRLFLTGALPVGHLWFLPALMFSLATLTLLARCRVEGYVLPLIMTLCVFALMEEVGRHLLGSTYNLRPWTIALLFTTLGWWLAGRAQPTVRTVLCLIVGGYALALMEGAVVSTFFDGSPRMVEDQYFLGGVGLALGIFLLALAKPNLGQSTPLPILAKFTLGVYVSHMLVLYTIGPMKGWIYSVWPGPGRGLLFCVLAYLLAVIVTLVVSKVPIARSLVTRTDIRSRLKTNYAENP